MKITFDPREPGAPGFPGGPTAPFKENDLFQISWKQSKGNRLDNQNESSHSYTNRVIHLKTCCTSPTHCRACISMQLFRKLLLDNN